MNKASIKINPLPASDEPIKKSIGQLSVDIYQTEQELVILSPVAGVSKDDITLEITDDVLVIRGKRPMQEEIPDELYYTRECFWGDFSRSIVLPLEADTNNIEASFENNVLEIHIPKKPIEKTQVIKIKAS